MYNAFTVGSFVCIVLATLWPFDFAFTATFAHVQPDFFLLPSGKAGARDIFNNIVLFAPFGFGLAGHLRKYRHQQATKALGVVIICSLTLSYVIEVLQTFQSTRFPALIDVLSNDMGGLLGYACFSLWDHLNLLLRFAGYILLLSVLSMLLQQPTLLSNWDESFSLVLGNEPTGERPWQGSVSALYLADRALVRIEVAHLWAAPLLCLGRGKQLLACYNLQESGGYYDTLVRLPPLIWHGAPAVSKGKKSQRL